MEMGWNGIGNVSIWTFSLRSNPTDILPHRRREEKRSRPLYGTVVLSKM